jgi:hypothetical protein
MAGVQSGMSISLIFNARNSTLDQYDGIIRALGAEALSSECTAHLCVKSEDGFIVYDEWTSPEAFDAFGVHLHPAIASVNLAPVTPDMYRTERIVVGPGEATESSIAAIFDLNITWETYYRVLQEIGTIEEAPEGRLLHAAMETPNGIRVVTAWITPDHLAKLKPVLGAAMERAGVPETAPSIYPVHRYAVSPAAVRSALA